MDVVHPVGHDEMEINSSNVDITRNGSRITRAMAVVEISVWIFLLPSRYDSTERPLVMYTKFITRVYVKY